MIPKSILLNEVFVNESTITAESLGIIPYGKKSIRQPRENYTQPLAAGLMGC
jgi:hypothetical protein